MAEREEIKKITQAGYAGMMPNGNIVDRRKYPPAIPMQKNTLLGIPEPADVWEPKIYSWLIYPFGTKAQVHEGAQWIRVTGGWQREGAKGEIISGGLPGATGMVCVPPDSYFMGWDADRFK